MSLRERSADIRRILVALDASPHSLAALEAAAELAARLEAELAGLFVEDIDLLNVAALPFSRQVGAFSRSGRRLDESQVERQLRSQAERARQALVAIAERARVRWSFRVTRGQVASEVTAAAADSDLLIMGRAGWSPGRRKRLGGTAQTVLSRSPCLAMVLRQGMRLGVPVIAFYDGSLASRRALDIAIELVHGGQGQLKVLLLARDLEGVRALQGEAEKRLPEGKAQFQALVGVSGAELVRAASALGQGLLVLPGEGDLLTNEVLQSLLDQIECPALVVRRR